MTQHCQMCDGTRADCTPCPGLVCAECADKDQQIASLTAMLEKSVTLDVWKMTVREFEKQIATLQAKYEYLLAKAAELLEPGGTGRTCALVVSQDLPKLLAECATLQAKLEASHADVRALAEELHSTATFESKTTGDCWCSTGAWLRGEPHEHKCTRIRGILARPSVRKLLEEQP